LVRWAHQLHLQQQAAGPVSEGGERRLNSCSVAYCLPGCRKAPNGGRCMGGETGPAAGRLCPVPHEPLAAHPPSHARAHAPTPQARRTPCRGRTSRSTRGGASTTGRWTTCSACVTRGRPRCVWGCRGSGAEEGCMVPGLWAWFLSSLRDERAPEVRGLPHAAEAAGQ